MRDVKLTVCNSGPDISQFYVRNLFLLRNCFPIFNFTDHCLHAGGNQSHWFQWCCWQVLWNLGNWKGWDSSFFCFLGAVLVSLLCELLFDHFELLNFIFLLSLRFSTKILFSFEQGLCRSLNSMKSAGIWNFSSRALKITLKWEFTFENWSHSLKTKQKIV